MTNETEPHHDHRDACAYFRFASQSLGHIADALSTVGNDRLASELMAMAEGLQRNERMASEAFGRCLSDRLADAQMHTGAMLATILHLGDKKAS